MGSKVCILCGVKPPPPLTGEHIFSDWYNRKDPARRYHLETIIDGKLSVRETQSLNLKPKVLCSECNNVWGSTLEERIEPIFSPMLKSKRTRLTLRKLNLITGWFTLKCMAGDYLDSYPVRFFSPEDGAHLLATLQPGNHARVWIGHYVGTRESAAWIMPAMGMHDLPVEKPTAIAWYSCTYSIGRVLLHFFDFKGPAATDGRQVDEREVLEFRLDWAPGKWSEGLTRIWPLPKGAIKWPPPKAFDDERFKYLAGRWNHLHNRGEPEE